MTPKWLVLTFAAIAVYALVSAWTIEEEVVERITRNIANRIVSPDLSAFTYGTDQEGVDQILTYLSTGKIVDHRQLQNIPSPDHTGLDSKCTNKLCNYMYYQLSCQAIGFDMKKICARYLLGSILDCQQFPHGENEVYQAPSICLEEYLGFLMKLAKPQALQAMIQSYLTVNFTENVCGRTCYQNFQNASNDFFLHCNSQLLENNSSYPLVAGMTNFQQFRNQACSINETGANCYSALSSLSHTSSSVSPFNFTCNYLNNTQMNNYVLNGFCSTFSSFGCCAASGIQIIFSNQQSTPPMVWPPCFLQYLNEGCATVNLRDYCSNGSIATQSVFRGSFKIPSTYTYYINVYNETSVLTAQGIISSVLGGLGLSVEPYNVNSDYPFLVQIVGYTYFDATGAALTPNNGFPASPSESDYTSSASGNFTYQLYLNNLDQSESNYVRSILNSTSFAVGINVAFGSTQQAPTATTTTGFNLYDPEPLPVSGTASLRSGAAFCVVSLVSTTLLVLQLQI